MSLGPANIAPSFGETAPGPVVREFRRNEGKGPGPKNLPDKFPGCNDQTPLYISFGAGLRLVNLFYLFKELEPVGFTQPKLIAMCRALGVPILHIGSIRLVDLCTFSLALKSALMQGRPDFWVNVENHPRHEGKKPTDCRVVESTDPDALISNLPDVMAQLLAGREIAGFSSKENFKTIKKSLQEAGARIKLAKAETSAQA